MTAAHLPSRLEPTGLFRSDSKRPDGITLAPWRMLPAQTHLFPTPPPPHPHLSSATSEADAVATLAKRSKHEKYLDLDQCHIFTPVAIKTAGPFGPETFSRTRLPPQGGDWRNQIIKLSATTPVCRSTTGECSCSDGIHGEYHLPF